MLHCRSPRPGATVDINSCGSRAASALIIVTLRNGSNQMGWPTYMQEIIIGIVIILAVGLDKLRQTRG